ncbi:MAG: hypothetical protein Q8N23_27495 [Archangium sp.]|nr:hypothetical protein [Archangium sp.]MDP3573102.1 hypothetical protein [Archangium sp.]
MQLVSLVLVLSLSDGTAAGRSSMLNALSSSLDPRLVSIKPRVLGAAKPETLDRLSERHPVAQVEWLSPVRAELRVALRPREWTSRTLTFSKKDPVSERAKSIAYAVAAMMPQWRPEQPSPPQPLEVVPLSPRDFEPSFEPDAGAPSPEEGALALEAGAPLPDAGEPEVQPEVDAGPEPEPEPAPVAAAVEDPPGPISPRGLVALSAVGTVVAPLVGAGVDVALCRLSWCFGVAGAFGAGELIEAQASRVEVRALATVGLRSAPWWQGRLGVAARVGGGAVFHLVTRQGEQLSRWVGAGLAELGPLLRFGWFELALTGGAHVSGRTGIWVGEAQATELPTLTGFARVEVALTW